MDSLLGIFPTARKAEQRLKQESRGRCRLAHRVCTFPQLIDRLFTESGRKPLAGPIGERLAVLRALGECKAETGLVPSAGLVDHTLRLIREFKANALEPSDLAQCANALGVSGRRRVAALARVFAEYERILVKSGLLDRHDRERQVLASLTHGAAKRPSALDGVNELLVAEIYDFGLLQFMIISALIGLVGNATLTIQAAAHQIDAARFPDLTWNRFVSEESIADKVLPDFVRRDGRQGRLGHVLENLFDPEPFLSERLPASDNTLQIIEAGTRYQEVEEIARTVRRRFADVHGQKLSPERIAIVARDLTPYRAYLEEVFERYRIPLALSTGGSLGAAPASRLLLDLIELAQADFPQVELERMLESPLLNNAAAHHKSLLRDCGYIDRKTRPLERCFELYRVRLENLAKTGDARQRERAENSLRRLERGERPMLELLAVLEELAAPATLADHLERFDRVLDRLGFEPERRLAHYQDRGQATAIARLKETLEELERGARAIAPQMVISAEEFSVLLGQTLSEAEVAEPSRSGAVQALSIYDARGLDFDLVFLLGLNDGVFPLHHGDDPLLPDSIRSALNRPLAARLRQRLGVGTPSALGKLLRTSGDLNSEDPFLFFLALSMAERQAVLSYALCDESGRPLSRSAFIDEVIRLLEPGEGDPLLRKSRAAPALEDCFARAEFRDFAAKEFQVGNLRSLAEAQGFRIDSIERRIKIEHGRERYLALPARERMKDNGAHPLKSTLADQYNGRVTADARLRTVLLGSTAAPRPWSPSMLDDLGACGFKFFSSRILGLRDEETVELEPSRLEVGTLAHEVLYRLYETPPDFSDREAAQERVRAFLASYRAVVDQTHPIRDNTLFDLTWKNLELFIEELVDWECAQHSGGTHFNQPPELEGEIAFALPDSRLVPEGEAIELKLRGRFDRLEYNRRADGQIDRLRIIDYKISRGSDAYARMIDPEGRNFARTAFQVPVYAMAAAERFARELAQDAKLEAGFLVLRHRDKPSFANIPLESLATNPERRRALAQRSEMVVADNVIELVAAALAGHFDVDPLDCAEYCQFRRVCRFVK